MLKQLLYWFLHRRRKSMSKLRQFRTTWDDSGQFGTRYCAIMVGSKRMVLVYPLSMSFFPTQRGFRWMPNSPSCTEYSVHAAESHWYPAYTNRPLRVGAQCRTMSHDAQVNTCYHINCQRRTRAHDAALHRRKLSTGSTSS